ncbi:MAG: prepilin-type N-terminal cleavage/methylation domain-containing protein [Bacteroidales bacterium]|nr:prepilin-type N-terminal cleavage/methylation domain-containing protein [Bacteroidales bacterium]
MQVKIRAYTIIELLVVLTISSIIMGFSIIIILNFSKSIKNIESSVNQQIEILSFIQILKKDLEKATGKPTYKNNEIYIPSFNSSTIYKFDNQFAKRISNNPDSQQQFEINNLKVKFDVTDWQINITIETSALGISTIDYFFQAKTICSENNYLTEPESEHKN